MDSGDARAEIIKSMVVLGIWKFVNIPSTI